MKAANDNEAGLYSPDSPAHLTWRRRHKFGPDGPTLDDIKEAMIATAELIDLYGEKLRPLMDRLEGEYRERTGRGTELQRIRAYLTG